MKFVMRIMRHGHKTSTIEVPLKEVSDNIGFEIARKVLEAEQTLNSIPGANLRIHLTFKDDEDFDV